MSGSQANQDPSMRSAVILVVAHGLLSCCGALVLARAAP